MIRIGMVDFDTSHVGQFTRRLNHVAIGEEQWVDGAKVVMGCPGTSEITDRETIDKYTREMTDDFGIEIVNDPTDMIGKIDAVMVESQDGSVHLERVRPFLEAGIPSYVDKPFACSVADANEIVRLAESKGLPLFSASSLRYGMEIVEFNANLDETGAVIGADAYSPASLHPRNPGLFHYGIHGVETLYTLMGAGCQTVRCVSSEGADMVTGLWEGGRIGTIRGTRAGGHLYGFTAFCEKKVVQSSINAGTIYRELLKQAVKMFETGQAPLDIAVTVEIVAFIVAAHESSQRGGEAVRVEPDS